MVNFASSVPPYIQVADLLRVRIVAGEWRPGHKLPAHRVLAHDYGVATPTVARAVALLRGEGLVELGTGSGTYVRDAIRKRPVTLPRSGQVDARMPTPAERERYEIDEGVPVVVVRTDRETMIYPADRHTFIVP